MQSRFLFIFITLVYLISSGCLYNGSNPYGYYGPGYYGAPQQPLNNYPVGGYPTYNPYPSPVGAPTYTPSTLPPSGQPTPIDNSSPPNTFKNGDGTTSPFDSNSPGSGKVPVPTDTGDDTTPTGSNLPNLTPTSKSSRKRDADNQTPFRQDSSSQLPGQNAGDPMAADEPVFESPVLLASGTDESVDDSSLEPSSVEISYGHSEKFEWLQGTVEYDERDENWIMIYTDKPQQDDRMGGEATLVDHPLLKNLGDGDVVRVTGKLDSSIKDARKLPKFRISSLKMLQHH